MNPLDLTRGGGWLAQLAGGPDRMTLLFGLAMFAGGILLMIQHLRQWQAVDRKQADERVRKFEWQKFRRRTLVAALIAGCGAICTSLAQAMPPLMRVTLVTALVLVLLLILALAAVDLMSVGLHQYLSRDHAAARRKLVEQIVQEQRRKKSQAAEQGAGPPAE